VPADLSFDSVRPIQVRDRAGVGLPFSKGLMATSILATGLETERAYQIAAGIERELRRRGVQGVNADELSLLAAQAITSEAGPDAAARYQAWRRVKRMGRPVITVLSGASGVGKSTLATRLAVRLGVTRVVTTDTIREVLRTVVPQTVLPELHVSTFEKPGDAPQDEDILASYWRQARAVCAATCAVARRLATEGRDAILEGVHIVPGQLSRELASHASGPIMVEFLLTLSDEDLHRRNLTDRVKREPARRGARHLGEFTTLRALQASLRAAAQRARVPELDASAPAELTQLVVDRVVGALPEPGLGVRPGADAVSRSSF